MGQSPEETSMDIERDGIENFAMTSVQESDCNHQDFVKKSDQQPFWSIIINILLTAVFIASTLVQINDASDVITWILFYLFHAIISVSVILAKFCNYTKFVKRFLILLSITMVIWSIGMIIVSAINLTNIVENNVEILEDDEEVVEGGDNDNATKKGRISL